MSACLWGTCWLHWSPGHICSTEWSQTINKGRADHITLCLFSFCIHLHPRTHHVSQLSPAARTVTSHQMFVITNLAKDTTSRAELVKDVSFPYAFHAKYLMLLKIILESHWLCTETNEEASQPVWLWEQWHPNTAQPFCSKFLIVAWMCVWNLRPWLAQKGYSFKDSG